MSGFNYASVKKLAFIFLTSFSNLTVTIKPFCDFTVPIPYL